MSESKTLVTLILFLLGFNLILGMLIHETNLSILCGDYDPTYDYTNYTSGNISGVAGYEDIYERGTAQIDCVTLPYWVWIIEISAISGIGYLVIKALPFT